MSDGHVAAPIVLVLASAAAAVWAADSGRRRLLAVAKPLTTALLYLVAGWPRDMFGTLVWVGITLSLVGDVALLFGSDRAFLVGLASFLVAYGTYAAAFVTAGRAAGWLLGPAAATGVATLLLVRALWAGAAGLRAPVIAYGATISTMVVAAWSTRGGALGTTAAALASVGATLLYVADASLALDKFRRPIPHASLLTMGVYWIGQLAVALSTR